MKRRSWNSGRMRVVLLLCLVACGLLALVVIGDVVFAAFTPDYEVQAVLKFDDPNKVERLIWPDMVPGVEQSERFMKRDIEFLQSELVVETAFTKLRNEKATAALVGSFGEAKVLASQMGVEFLGEEKYLKITLPAPNADSEREAAFLNAIVESYQNASM
jgi:hypothetical protein